ncbi:MAG TPA: PTS sugar transporter subunit IIA [Anaerolineae bacterium]|nr:PTS sugar transporter subunit IIA [Anaerolineae bacterium]
MIGIVIAAHGSLPEALLDSTRMIYGEPNQTATVALMPGDSLEDLIERLRAAVEQVNSGDGVLILLDMFGGTPANAAALISQQIENAYAVTGANLPMLLETFMQREGTERAVDLTETAFAAGQAGIINVVEAFKKFRQSS